MLPLSAASRIPLLIAGSLVVLIVVLGATMVLLSQTFHSELAAHLDPHLDEVAAELAAEWRFVESNNYLQDRLRRIRDRHQLDDVLVLDHQAHILASASGMRSGVSVSPFAVDRREWPDQEAVVQRYQLLGGHQVRVLQPLSGGLILCLEARDPVPESAAALELPMSIAASVIVLAVIVFGFGQWWTLRVVDRSRQHSERIERLANVGAVAAGIAHEVRNPLGVILASGQLLARDPDLDERQRELVDGICEEVKRADHQLDTFLEISRDMPLKRRPCDCGMLAEELCALVDARGRQDDITIICEAESGCMISGDARRLRQALLNLLLNAMQAIATKGEGGTVTVMVQRSEQGIEIAVTDDGPGIPRHLVDQIREPFMTTKEHGTGLGLSSAITVVERHGGHVEIVSDGEGTIVRCYLPLV